MASYTYNTANFLSAETLSASGLKNAMGQTQNIRDWAKAQRSSAQFMGAGIGINIRRDRQGKMFMMSISVAGRTDEFEFEDEFEMLEAIQHVVEEMWD